MTLVAGTASLPAGQPTAWRFRIVGPSGGPVTAFRPEQTQLMHMYLVRDDLTGFQHIHPAMSPDGRWRADFEALAPGSYRVYAQFTAAAAGASGGPAEQVLSTTVDVPGGVTAQQAPPALSAAPAAEVGGYTVAVGWHPEQAGQGPLSLTFARDRQPVTDLQPYLGSYAHLTAVHAGDLAFAHMHPHGTVAGDHGGPGLDFHARFPEPGAWRLFVQFQARGVLHTAAVTLVV